MAATKAPTGVTIARNNNNFTVQWKIADKDYGNGQQFQYRFTGQKWTSVSVGTGTTSKVVPFPAASYYPAKSTKAKTLQVRIRGNRKAYTTGSGSKKKAVNPGWSAWTTKVYTFDVPRNPSVSAALSDEHSNVSTFTWSVTTSATDVRHFVNCEWQTVLVKNCNYTDGSKAPWKSSALGWGTGTTSASGSITRTEDTVLLAAASYTRWVRVRARGARGVSEWRYAKHVYARPYQAVINKVTPTENNAGGLQVKVTWTAAQTAAYPIDRTTVEYAIIAPGEGMTFPSGGAWTEANISRDTGGQDAATFSIDDVVGEDEALFVRVNTIHDNNITHGVPALGSVGYLASPSSLSVTTNDQTHMASVTATNNSQVPGAFLAVIYRGASAPGDAFICGIIPNGSTSANVQGPDWSGETAIEFGVRAYVGTYTTKIREDGATAYVIDAQMESLSTIWDGGAVPSAPGNMTVRRGDLTGMVNVAWEWSWDGADEIELSWSQSPYAWQSTSEPQSYTVSNLYASNWNIEGLETGVPWYIRARFIQNNGDVQTYGPYSDMLVIDLASAPNIPTLSLSTGVITEAGSVTASWGYSSTDGTGQGYADIIEYNVTYEPTEDTAIEAGKTYYELDDETSSFVEVEAPVAADLASYYERVESYGDIIAHTETAQHATINASDVGWTAGNQYGLCVRVVSQSGRESDAWSDPVFVAVAEPLEAAITQTSLETVTIVDDEEEQITSEQTALTAMPLTLTVTGAGAGGTTTVVIERAASYYLDRPDDTTFNGHEGETIALYTQTGEEQITINREDLIGPLDDGAPYRIIATVQDGLGQSASASLNFVVAWAHQALIPEADVVIDTQHNVAKITPTAPTGTEAGDTFDIYRLSADRPELVVEGGEWGTTYVDPYPAIGEYGGHRVVFRTVDGDYITADNHEAWIDLGEDEGDRLDLVHALIDFDGNQIPVMYDVTLTNRWEKDFAETKYLGGAIQGDWNAGVSRTGSVNARAVVAIDSDTILALRRLATWTGICHVRTLDGSSFAADVQVQEDASFEHGVKTREIGLIITRVDPEGPEGLTLAQWEQGLEG